LAKIQTPLKRVQDLILFNFVFTLHIMNYQTVEEFITPGKPQTIVDVRTPAEFNKGHIPGAINIPLFSNDERHDIGLLYKESGKKIAVKKGLEFVGPKLNSFIAQLESSQPTELIHVHCWRGGMRSSSMGWLFETAGFKVNILTGGYKSYRQLLNGLFDPFTLFLIGGETGSGKTKVLQELDKLGEQVIDLESLANHKGSAFGGIGENGQPSSEQFQNMVINEFLKIDPSKKVFIEDESSSIGKVGLPTTLWKKMKASKIIQLSLPVEERVINLVSDYGDYSKKGLECCILKIQRKLGGLETKKSIEALYQKKMDVVARKLLAYYDKSYRFLLERNKNNILAVLPFERFDAMEIARSVQKHIN